MKEISGRQLQLRLLEVLDQFCSFAHEHNLVYYLGGGTLLGAIRHKGFIPWDDDVDIMMPRKDYEYLRNNFRDDRYILSDCNSDHSYDSPYIRIWDNKTTIQWKTERKTIGVYIDIFPIDGYPDSYYLSKIRENIIMFNRKRLGVVLKKPETFTGRLAPVKRFVQCFLGNANTIAQKMDRFARKYDYEKCRFVGVQIGTHNTFKERNPKDLYEKSIMVDFEGRKLPAPIGYDEYLKHLFCDYMTLPPEEKRCSDHKTPFYEL